MTTARGFSVGTNPLSTEMRKPSPSTVPPTRHGASTQSWRGAASLVPAITDLIAVLTAIPALALANASPPTAAPSETPKRAAT